MSDPASGEIIENSRRIFEQQRQRKIVPAEQRPDPRGEPVEQHDRKRAPLDHDFGRDGVALGQDFPAPRYDHPHVDEEPAIAVLRQSGEQLDPADREASIFERLDERVAEPLR